VLPYSTRLYLSYNGTDSAYFQVVNTMKTAFEERRAAYNASWDIAHATADLYDSNKMS